jgi:hypothetical protein
MITSGLVLTLNADAALAEQAVASLHARPEFTPGERNDRWLPVALEAADDDASRAAHDWLNSLPGVEFVDVVAVNFEGEESLRPEEVSGNAHCDPVCGSTGGAEESSPQRKLWEQRDKSRAPEGRKKIVLAAEKSVAPTGLGSSLTLTHGSRRGLLSAAAPQLTHGSHTPATTQPRGDS